MNNILKKFVDKYVKDEDFRGFVDSMENEEVINSFVYDLYMKYGKNTFEVAGPWVNRDLLDIDKLIEYFTNIDEFEKCSELNKIKKEV